MSENKIPSDLDITKVTREELYQYRKLPQWGQFLRQDMILRGFYIPENANNKAELTARLTEVNKELTEINEKIEAIRKDEAKIADQKAAVDRAKNKQQMAHSERLRESKERREAARAQRIQEREERIRAWNQKKQSSLIHIGDFDSAALHDTDCDEHKLNRLSLPLLRTDLEVLHFLQAQDTLPLTLKRLRHLCTRNKLSRFHLYHRFEIPKKTGGARQISAPVPILRQLQRQILDGLLNKVELHGSAHGFTPNRSIVSNADPHTGKAIVINMDLKDFFPSITFPRVRGLFKGLGYSLATSTLLAVLCTEPDVRGFTLDGERWYQHQGTAFLPQGSPASPAITNLICRRLDARLEGLANALGYTYTRYADDLTFSTDSTTAPIQSLLGAARTICLDEGFQVHPDKTRVMRSGRRQEVTGIIVNDKLNVCRKRMRRFRAYLHHVSQNGIHTAEWEGAKGKDSIAKAIGFAAFVHAVHQQGGQVLAQSLAVLAPHR